MRRAWSIGAAVAVIAVAVMVGQPAHGATYAGKDGGIAYSQFGKHGPQILVASTTSHKITNVSKKNYGDDEPAFSPDGTKLLFRNNDDIWTMTASGAGRTDLTPGGANDHGSYGNPSWSADGTQITFIDEGNLAVMNADGSDLRTLTTDGDAATPDWSPDGTEIAFTSVDDPGDISHVFTIHPDGSHLTDISAETDSSDEYYDQNPSWSPDSAHLLVDSDRTAAECCIQIFELSRDGASATYIPTDTTDNTFGPVFSPDGTSLAFTGNDQGTNQIFVQSLASESDARVVSKGSDTAIGNDASWQALFTTTLKVAPKSGKAGSKVTVTLAGYAPNDSVALTLAAGSTTTSLGTVTVSSAGTATAQVTIPTTASPGSAHVTGLASPSGRTATGAFTVKAP